MKSHIDATVDGILDEVLPQLVALRRELHAHPEVRFEEHWTSDRICTFLHEAGIPHSRGHVRGTGIVATIEGAPGGKTVVLRADMDGLEINEQTALPYASAIAHCMHACGHDGHVACLCGTARVLSRLAQSGLLKNNVRLIFQPAEELGAGGRHVAEEGLLDGADAAFALHAWPSLRAGLFGIKAGSLMASADWFRITVNGQGCHGADPARGIDPIVLASHLVIALQSIVSREIDPQDPAVLTIGKIESGCANNVIPESATLEGSFRAMDAQVRSHIFEAIERIAQSVAAAFRATATVMFGEDYYIPLANDEKMTDFARQTIIATLGPDAVMEMPRPTMASEDFAFYLEKVPGSFIVLGTGVPDHPVSLHSPYFDFNDDVIAPAVKVLTALATHFPGEP